MAIPARVSVITLGVENVAESTAFYERLGWPASGASNERITFIQLAGGLLALFPRAALAEDARRDLDGHGATLAINVETPEEVATVLEEAVAAGAQLLKPAQQAEWGGVSGYFADPDGHPWEVAFAPGFEFDAGGIVRIPKQA